MSHLQRIKCGFRAIAIRCCWLVLAAVVTIGWASTGRAAPNVTVDEITRFTGTTRGDQGTTGGIPPDTMGAVGGGRFAELINNSFAVYKLNGTLLDPRVSLEAFWNDAFANTHNNPAPGSVAPPLIMARSTFDPRIVFDVNTQRWYATAVDHRRSAASSLYIAVTTGSDPRLGNWRGFALDVDADDQRWADFPTLGYNKDGVFLGVKMLDIDPDTDPVFGTRTDLIGVPRSSLTGTNPDISGLRTVENVKQIVDALQPAIDTGASTQLQGAPYRAFASLNGGVVSVEIPADFFSGGALGSRDVMDALIGLPPINVAYGNAALHPIDVDAGPVELDSNVVLTWSGYWGVSHVQPQGGGNNAIYWFNADPDTGETIAEGLIEAPDFHYLYPSISVSPYGKVVIGANLMFDAVANPIGNGPGVVAFPGVTDVNGVTTFGQLRLLQPGLAKYDVIGNNGTRNRWGDYSATTLADTFSRFATIQEYVASTNVWATSISILKVMSDNDVEVGSGKPGSYGSNQPQDYGDNSGGGGPGGGAGGSEFSLQDIRFTGMFTPANLPDELNDVGDMKVERYALLMDAVLEMNGRSITMDDLPLQVEQKFTLLFSDDGVKEYETELLMLNAELVGDLGLLDLAISLDPDRASMGRLALTETLDGTIVESYIDLFTMLHVDRDGDGRFDDSLPSARATHLILRIAEAPEPITACLTLLAFCALLIRRRRLT